MARRCPVIPKIRTVQFSARIAAQCALGSRTADWAVCTTIAFGARRILARAGSRGGTLCLFSRNFPHRLPHAPAVAVSVVGELVRGTCRVLRFAPGSRPEKIWAELGFLNRSDPK